MNFYCFRKTANHSWFNINDAAGWIEPSQQPEFNEYTLVLKGKLQVETRNQNCVIREREAILIGKGERVRVSTPFETGAEYFAICLLAFSINTVNRIKD